MWPDDRAAYFRCRNLLTVARHVHVVAEPQ